MVETWTFYKSRDTILNNLSESLISYSELFWFWNKFLILNDSSLFRVTEWYIGTPFITVLVKKLVIMALYFSDELCTTHSIMQTVHLNTNIYYVYIIVYNVQKTSDIFCQAKSFHNV